MLLVGIVGATTVRVYATTDGMMSNYSASGITWPIMRNGTGIDYGTDTTDVVEIQAASSSPLFKEHIKSGVTFPTSLYVPAGATVTAATVGIKGNSYMNTLTAYNGVSLSMVDFNPASKGLYIASDLDKTTHTRVAPDVSYSSFETTTDADGIVTFPLNRLGLDKISKTGNTTFLFDINRSVDNSAISYLGSNTAAMFFFDAVSSANPPYIDITYTTDQCYGASECNPTEDPIGGGRGYSRVITSTNSSIAYVVTSKAQLLSALGGSPGIIFIPSTANIDMSGTFSTNVPNGFTLASDRGYDGSQGGRIYQTILGGDPTTGFPNMFTIGNNVRITGLRIEGPQPDTTYVGPEGNQRSGIAAYAKSGDEIDNCNISGWSFVGVWIGTGGSGQESLGKSTTELGSAVANINHNYIHHCQQEETGYGIETSASYALIKANLFDYTRHAITGQGNYNEGYEATYNVHLGNTTYPMFDVHGYPTDAPTSIAGDTYRIKYNTFNSSQVWPYDIQFRAAPINGATIQYNRLQVYTNPALNDNIPPVYSAYCNGITMSNNLLWLNQTLWTGQYIWNGTAVCPAPAVSSPTAHFYMNVSTPTPTPTTPPTTVPTTVSTTATTSPTTTVTTPPPGDLYGVSSYSGVTPIGGGAGYTGGIYTTGDYTVTTLSQFNSHMVGGSQPATSGQVVFIPSGTNITFPSGNTPSIPAGVTIASDRGYNGHTGAVLKKTQSSGGWSDAMLLIGGNNVRVTGLTLEGEMLPSSAEPLESESLYLQGIRNVGSYTGEVVDNNEIRGWAYSGVEVKGVPTNGRPWIHNNYFHHNQARGEGYGTEVNGGDALVEANTYDYNRHDITGTGRAGEQYTFQYNLILGHCDNPTGGNHVDVHENGLENPTPMMSGSTYIVRYNTVYDVGTGSNQEAFLHQSANPTNGMYVSYNDIQTNWGGSWVDQYTGLSASNYQGVTSAIYQTRTNEWPTWAGMYCTNNRWRGTVYASNTNIVWYQVGS